jgi:hypothetical protein
LRLRPDLRELLELAPASDERQCRRSFDDRRRRKRFAGCDDSPRRRAICAPQTRGSGFEHQPHVGGALIPVARILSQTFLHDLAETRRHVWRQRHRRIAQDGREQVGNDSRVERLGARQHLEQQHAERPDVRRRIGSAAAYEFRRHCIWRPGRDSRR